MDGQWFRYRSSFTGSETECRRYADEFATEQRNAGVVGTRIRVVTRGSLGVATYPVDS